MSYITVFNVANVGYKSAIFPAIGLILVASGILFVLIRNRIPGWTQRPQIAKIIFPFGYLCFAGIWTLAAFVGTYGDYRRAQEAQAAGTASVVEGVVTDFVPMPVTGHAMEHFCVSGVCFNYSDYVMTAGFNRTSSHGGPIREGLPIRVTYIGNTILKLEVGSIR